MIVAHAAGVTSRVEYAALLKPTLRGADQGPGHCHKPRGIRGPIETRFPSPQTPALLSPVTSRVEYAALLNHHERAQGSDAHFPSQAAWNTRPY